MNRIPGKPEVNTKDLEAEVILLRRKVRQLEERLRAVEQAIEE